MAEQDGGETPSQFEIGLANVRLFAARVGQLGGGGAGAAGGFRVDPERARGCIDELGRILDEVRRSLLDMWRMQFAAPGFDDVSRNASHNGSIMASRAEAYIVAWANQIEATRNELQRELDSYRGVEQDSAGRLM